MAIMIPDSCPAKASAGEKRLFRLFQNLLPDSFRVWYEPVVKGRYPDFVLLADTFGLVLIEVKGWYARHIRRVTDTEVERVIGESGEERIETDANPLRQVRDWRTEGFALGVSVNLSVRDLTDELPGFVQEQLDALDLPADVLTLEITESSIMSDPARTTFESWCTMERAEAPGVIHAAGGATTIWVDFKAGKAAAMPDWLRALVTG